LLIATGECRDGCKDRRGFNAEPACVIGPNFFLAPNYFQWDSSLSKKFKIYGRTNAEFRVDMFNALNHTQFTGVNATANFASLTDKTITNLPYDASGNLVRPNGFGTINGVAPPRQLQVMTRISF